MARIAMVVTNACSPDPRVLRHAEWLVREGHEVTVHAYDRQELHPLSESRHGVRIMRYHLGKSPYGGLMKTALGIRQFNKNVLRGLTTNQPDILYCHDADTLVVGSILKKKYGTTVVFDMHDLQHSWVRMPAPNSMIRRIISKGMESRMLNRLKFVDKIITSSGKISPNGKYGGFREYLEERGHSSTVVENRPEQETSLERQDKTGWSVGYVGRVREVDSFQFLLEAILLIEAEKRPKIRIAGDGVAFQSVSNILNSAQKKHGIEIEITGRFDAEESSQIIQNIDVMFAMYCPKRGNILQGALPVKMFDAAAHGVPSIVNSECIMQDIVHLEEIGESVEWLNREDLAKSLLSLRGVRVELATTSERERKRFSKALKPLFDC
tara:strand:+ start:25377 stop:26519 length:1143 start_codon:yes stop_codon:yes gene_type:complete